MRCLHKQFFYTAGLGTANTASLGSIPRVLLTQLLHKLYFAWDIVKSGLDWTLGLNILTTETVIHALWVGCRELSERVVHQVVYGI